MSQTKRAFIAGCMDGPNGLHSGHLHLLKEARKLIGEYGQLLVALNNDMYITRVKGRAPLATLEERKLAVIGTYLVDGVFDFYANPIDLILQYEPTYIITGDDYKPEQVIGHDVCHKWGGSVVIIPRIPNVSTSEIIAAQKANKRFRIKNLY
jgi:D-beta-D-heptose 7-phosphate kinase/D-beta-D-heptose 1-phosphate adenosyltransferase